MAINLKNRRSKFNNWSIAMQKLLIRLTKISLTLVAVGIALISGSAYAQSPLNWRSALYYDNGVQPSIAVLPSGLVVEFHQSEKNKSLYYRVGTVVRNVNGTHSITWGDSQHLGYAGERPDVAVTKEGYVLLVYTKGAYTGYGSEVQMRYWVGDLNPAGDSRQTITWRVRDAFFDNGQFASLAFNSNAVLIEAHEGFHTDNLYSCWSFH
jgi:hypothetical protein